jgi:hypothetical protein
MTLNSEGKAMLDKGRKLPQEKKREKHPYR